jgi:nicotinate dehydrogenase subunit A
MSRSFDLVVNGEPVQVETEGDRPLLSVLRETLHLKGTRYGCGQEHCGSCMVLIDGAPTPSCTRVVDSVAGRTIITVEGLDEGGMLSVLRQAFLDEQAGQCGYCLSGILVSAAALLARNPHPSRDEVAGALDRNLCRCGAHNRIIRAVQKAGAMLSQRGTV